MKSSLLYVNLHLTDFWKTPENTRKPLFRVFHNAKSSAVCAEIMMGSKFNFFQWKKYFEIREYLIHYV